MATNEQPIHAQGIQPRNQIDPPQALELRIQTSAIANISQPFDVEVEVSNHDVVKSSPPRHYFIQRIDIILPDSLVMCEPPDPEAKSEQQPHQLTRELVVPNPGGCPRPPHVYIDDVGLEVEKGQKIFKYVHFESGRALSRLFKSLLYRSADTVVIAEVQYYVDTASQTGDLSGTATVRPNAPLTAVFLGGAAGVILANLIVLLRRLALGAMPASWISDTTNRKDTSDERGTMNPNPSVAPVISGLDKLPKRSWVFLGVEVWTFIIRVLYGTVATVVAILLLSLTTVSSFPVSVSVSDALGGLIVGLFNKPVADFIYAKLFVGDRNAP